MPNFFGVGSLPNTTNHGLAGHARVQVQKAGPEELIVKVVGTSAARKRPDNDGKGKDLALHWTLLISGTQV
jgi:hypothetical protein